MKSLDLQLPSLAMETCVHCIICGYAQEYSAVSVTHSTDLRTYNSERKVILQKLRNHGVLSTAVEI